MTRSAKTARRAVPRTAGRSTGGAKYWSAEVTGRSNALDLECGIFTWNDPRRIAESLKRSAEASTRRRGTAFQSAMAMLNFYVNRAGRNLPAARRRILEKAKADLSASFGAGSARS